MHKSKLYTFESCFEVDIIDIKCGNCHEITQYTGVNDHLFRGKENVVTHHNLFDMFGLLRFHNKITMDAYYTSIGCMYYNCNSPYPFPAHDFPTYYLGYIRKQTWSNDIHCGGCRIKNQRPPIVGADGTDLVIKALHAQNCISPADTHECHQEPTVKMRTFTNNNSMVYIKKYKTRRKLMYYYKMSKICRLQTDRIYTKDRKLTETEIVKLQREISEDVGNDYYVKFMDWI